MSDEAFMTLDDNSKSVKQWLTKLATAKKHYEKYYDLAERIRKVYKNEDEKNKTNIFWSSVETLKPFLYFKQPKPYVDRVEKAANPVAATACKILEKALQWDLTQFDFDGVIKYVRNDFLLLGCGLAYEKYVPTFKQVEVDGKIADIVDKATVETVYVDPVDFLADSDHVKIWEDCTWWARRLHMTRQEVIDQFGSDFEKDFVIVDEEKDWQKSTEVFEIHDLRSGTVIYLSSDVKRRFLKVIQLPSQEFVSLPKPLFATLANDGIVPVPDYAEIKCLLNEYDGVVERMRLTMKALKVTGAYDKAFPELYNILNKDVTLVGISDFQKLKDAGGIRGIIDFAPIEQYVTVLQELAARRQDIQQQIFEITGVSDIMRGNADPNETATAVKNKTNFGTLRNQDRQNDMQRFITDLFKIKAEIICSTFPDENLAAFLDEEEQQNMPLVKAAIQLLKTDKLRGMVLGIETDTAFNQDQTAQKVHEAMELVNTMIVQSVQVVGPTGASPWAPLYRKMIESVVASLPNGRQWEPVIEQVFNSIQQAMAQPKPEQPNPEMLKIQNEQQKNAQEFQVKQRQNDIRQQEVELKKQAEDNKIMMQNKEAEMQFALKKREQDLGQDVSANITTGYVRNFD